MGATLYDVNFKIGYTPTGDETFYNALDIKGALKGVYYDREEKIYRRMPDSVAEKVSEGVRYFSRCTAGGRLKIKTNSNYLIVKAVIPKEFSLPTMSGLGQFSFSVEGEGVYYGPILFNLNDFLACKSKHFGVQGRVNFSDNRMRELTVHFPLYNGVNELFIGVQKGSVLEKGCDYSREKPVVFYGSSITEGGCSSRPDTDYISTISKLIDVDFINLGFSGNCKGETEMAKYIAGLDHSVFVMDYDHNSTSVEMLSATHYNFYKTYRSLNPHTPIVFITRPNIDRVTVTDENGDRECAIALCEVNDTNANYLKRQVIYKTYQTALSNGDENVYFIDGSEFFGSDQLERSLCLVDGAHPNDLGFYRMAKGIVPTLKKILKL